MTLTDFHGRLAGTAQLYFMVLALWGFLRFFRKKGVDSSYLGGLAIGEMLIVAQALVGGVLMLMGHSPARGIHVLYGLLVPAIIPLVYSYTKGREGRSEALVYATALLVAAVLIMRAIFTGEVAL